MNIVCLDLEGVLVPEIWINVANKTNTKELLLTTRDISDYDKLMRYRLKILKEKNIKYKDIFDIINCLSPLDGAIDFLNILKERYQVIILSDTYYDFAKPLMKKLNYPTLFCHRLVIDDDGYIRDYKLRIKNSKKEAVKRLKQLKFKIIASGDSYNDIDMLKTSHKGILFCPPENVIKEFPQFPVARNYSELLSEITKAEEELK
ncbi:MAG TPA: bifunctional phosphoserine phosphatase/homoserine phosphotransferase ThrH [Spirochaetota bacterium]|nr:bifunctional phosphoserine phosphatase/homoserine phosphotransferase ThrH [Spirochaetota bacterium]HOL57957.1 bifunctional phosphoserine phosphatase/homoserine phosphotransferase ThrH [Spirochaetota bacterium]HPP05468.1 bifunctional phosphoserine phosphatase/homoserine phosphotransferase ThrH [Spirochaetota bacterium]